MWAFFVGDFMAIQTINLTVPGGDTPRSANTKINANFSDATHAASKLIGAGEKNKLTLNQDLFKGAYSPLTLVAASTSDANSLIEGRASFYTVGGANMPEGASKYIIIESRRTSSGAYQLGFSTTSSDVFYRVSINTETGPWTTWAKLYNTSNTTIVNGSLKPSSPVVKIHTDSLELNDDAEKMGVTLNKRGVGDYLLQNTTGLRNDGGWRIELPQDVNGNPYFAVAYNELENNDIEVKTYKRIFDMNTFMFGPDLDSPVDIKEGSSIAIRFNDLPQDDIAGSPAQTNNP